MEGGKESKGFDQSLKDLQVVILEKGGGVGSAMKRGEGVWARSTPSNHVEVRDVGRSLGPERKGVDSKKRETKKLTELLVLSKVVKVISFDDHLVRLVCHNAKWYGPTNKVSVVMDYDSIKAHKSCVENNRKNQEICLSINHILMR